MVFCKKCVKKFLQLNICIFDINNVYSILEMEIMKINHFYIQFKLDVFFNINGDKNMRQLIEDYVNNGVYWKPKSLSRKRKNEIKHMVDCSESIKLRVNSIYRQKFKWFKSQWHDANLPCEHQSDFWEDVLNDTQNEIMAFFNTNLPEIKTTSEENFAKLDCICEGYLKSNEFNLMVKQLKNDWKKELLVRDFK